MPLFNHKCKVCGYVEEFLVKGSDKPKKQCVKCASIDWEKLFTNRTSIAFKGSGFYVTDNKKP